MDQQLKAHGIHHVIVIGLRANMCVEATVRFAAELGYEVTMVESPAGAGPPPLSAAATSGGTVTPFVCSIELVKASKLLLPGGSYEVEH